MNSTIVPFVSPTETLKKLLINGIFSASYGERRYIEALAGYRDILQIDNDDCEFIDILKMTVRNLEYTLLITFMEQQGDSFVLYTNINGLQFGNHWFQITDLYSRDSNIIIVVKHLRQYKKKEEKINIDWNELYNEFANMLNNDLYSSLRFFIQFLVVALVTIVSVAVQVIPYLSEYLLKLMRELSNLITALTPVVIRLIDFLSSIGEGFYRLIASLATPNSSPPRQHTIR